VVSVRILGLELRRILKTKITIILLIAALGLTFVMAYLPITYVHYSYVNAEGNVVEVKTTPQLEVRSNQISLDPEGIHTIF
jgi:hypothetical protein